MTRWSLFLQTLSLLHHFLGLYSSADAWFDHSAAGHGVGRLGLWEHNLNNHARCLICHPGRYGGCRKTEELVEPADIDYQLSPHYSSETGSRVELHLKHGVALLVALNSSRLSIGCPAVI